MISSGSGYSLVRVKLAKKSTHNNKIELLGQQGVARER